MDTGDDLMRFMDAALADESNPTDKASSPTPDEQENNITDYLNYFEFEIFRK